MMLLEALAVPPRETGYPSVRYDEHRQVNLVLDDGRWVESWRSGRLAATKKADVETGEDAKGT